MPTFEVPGKLIDGPFLLTATNEGYTLAYKGSHVLDGKIGEVASGDAKDGPISIFVRVLMARPGTRFVVIRNARQDVLAGLSHEASRLKNRASSPASLRSRSRASRRMWRPK